MKPNSPFVVCLVLFVSFAVVLRGNDGYLRDDAFDVNQGTVILGSSDPYPQFDVRDIFGGDYGTYPGEAFCTIFAAQPPIDNVDWVEFQTREEVPLVGYHLICGNEYPTFHRNIEKFTLFVDRNGSWVKVDEVTISNTAPRLAPYVGVETGDEITRPLPQRTIGEKWRVEFLRGGVPMLYPTGHDGPRIYELDAYTTTNLDRPQISWTAPDGSVEYNEPAEIQLETFARDDDGINRVEFFYILNGTTNLIGKADVNGTSYTFRWNDVKGGEYDVLAKAVDNLGAAEYSSTTRLVVRGRPPSVASPEKTPDGLVQFRIGNLVLQQVYVVEVSPDLKAWNEYQEIYADSDFFNFVDSTPTQGVPQKFYRVKRR